MARAAQRTKDVQSWTRDLGPNKGIHQVAKGCFLLVDKHPEFLRSVALILYDFKVFLQKRIFVHHLGVAGKICINKNEESPP